MDQPEKSPIERIKELVDEALVKTIPNLVDIAGDENSDPAVVVKAHQALVQIGKYASAKIHGGESQAVERFTVVLTPDLQIPGADPNRLPPGQIRMLDDGDSDE